MDPCHGLLADASDTPQELQVLGVKVGEVTIQNHGERPILKVQCLLVCSQVLLICFTIPGINWKAGLGNGSRCIVLGGEDVAAGPLYLSTQGDMGLNKDSCLKSQVQVAGKVPLVVWRLSTSPTCVSDMASSSFLRCLGPCIPRRSG